MTIEQALSVERLERYNRWAGGDQEQAFLLYTLNVQVSEALYIPLHTVEITLRNAIHDALTTAYGSQWYANAKVPIDEYQRQKIEETIRKRRKTPTDGQVVSDLMFGFWSAMFGRDKHALWGKCFRPMFDAGFPLQRKQVASRLDRIRLLRNRVAHHEPIIQLDLQGIHSEIREIIGWLSTDALQWNDQRSRFFTVHPGHVIIEGGLIHPVMKPTGIPPVK